jgi:hypothetical protein
MESQQEREEERPQQERLDSFFAEYHFVVMRQCSHMVSTAMARHIECELDRWPRPRWIAPESRALLRRFRDERDREDPPEPLPF